MTGALSRPVAARVLILSMFLAPCREVGGKRFTYLSRYLSRGCEEYHILARREQVAYRDATAFEDHVHRVRMLPHHPPRKIRNFLHGKLVQAWIRWFCLIDPEIGWTIPSTVAGIRLCRRYRLNTVIVTVPSFAAVISGVIIARLCGVNLIIDYRDPWTNLDRPFPLPVGRQLCAAIERAAIQRASAIVFCTERMRSEFVTAFGRIAPRDLAVIYNGFEAFEAASRPVDRRQQFTMTYAGSFYGTRRLNVIAPVLAEMAAEGEIGADSFRFDLYTELVPEDQELIERLGLQGIIKVNDSVPYEQIKRVMLDSDVLFLPSGDDVPYAVPYKFFDYLSVRRPILAVAPLGSGVHRMMELVDCGELAGFGNHEEIRQKLQVLLRRERTYTFEGAERFRWENAARQYLSVIKGVVGGARSIR